MIGVTLAGLRAHARRMLATALAVIFGVGFVAGTLIFTDSIRQSFFDSFARQAKNVDAAGISAKFTQRPRNRSRKAVPAPTALKKAA